MEKFDWLERQFEELRAGGLVREPGDAGLREELMELAREGSIEFVDASSNDYLGYGGRGISGDSGEGARWGVDDVAQWGESGVEGCGGDGVARKQGLGCRSMEAHLVSRETLTPLSNRSDPRTTNDPVDPPLALSGQHGAGASRLLGGTRRAHTELERQLADWVGQADALLFSSGYAANVGLQSCLPQRGDLVFSDEYNHASIIDGCRLGSADTVVYPHCDLGALSLLLQQRRPLGRSFIVTESYFSMDADTPNLPRLRKLADDHNAILVVDEAHALGTFGPRGAGLCAQHGVQPDVIVGTLGKAVGLQGAFVASPTIVRSWLWNRARSFVYSTAPTPTLARLTQLHVKHIQKNDGARATLASRAHQIRQAIARLGLVVPPESHGPIIPILLGSVERAMRAARALRANGILVYPIRPPTVPKDSARIRLTVTASMSEAAYAHLLKSLPRCLDVATLAD